MRHSMSHSCVSGMGLDLCNTSKEDTVSKSKTEHATTHAKEVTMAEVIADATPEKIAIAKGWVADRERATKHAKDKREGQEFDIMADALRAWLKAGDA